MNGVSIKSRAIIMIMAIFACINIAQAGPSLVITPDIIGYPTWTAPGTQLDTTNRLENAGDADLNVAGVSIVELAGPAGWLNVGNTGPIIIPPGEGGYYDLAVYLNYNGIITSGPEFVYGYLIIESNSEGGGYDTVEIHLTVAESEPCCDVPGDCCGDGVVNLLDVTCMIRWLYQGWWPPTCRAQCDVNGNCSENILDITGLIIYLYKGGPAPRCPSPECPLNYPAF
ncbi:MAG: dockerin type I domain-containing protein [Candidatus Zixiibacteriota bacterium]